MSNHSVGLSETLNRYVYPPFTALWSRLRSVTGRERRQVKHADAANKSAEKQRRKSLWKSERDA